MSQCVNLEGCLPFQNEHIKKTFKFTSNEPISREISNTSNIYSCYVFDDMIALK